MEEIVRKRMDLYFFELKTKLISIFAKHIEEKGFNIIYEDGDDFTAYGTDTASFTMNLVSDMAKEVNDPKGDRVLSIYSKRVNINTIKIRFGQCPLSISLINIVFDTNFLSPGTSKDRIRSFLFLHNSFHQLSFPEIYRFIEDGKDILEKHIEAEKDVFSLEKENTLPMRSLPKLDKEVEEVLYPFEDEYVNIGYDALRVIYDIKTDSLPYREIIFPSDFFLILKAFKKKGFRYKLIRSDFEFYNASFIIYSKKNRKEILRVYKGDNFCYPFLIAGSRGEKYGTYTLIMKYVILHYLSDKDSKLLKLLKKVYKRQNKEGGIIESLNPKCLGENVSSYKDYYTRIWGAKIWTFKKNIRF